MSRYNIIRYYQDHPEKIIKSGVTLAEAERHCQDRETSSSTCEGNGAIAHCSRFGEWFDGFRPMRPKRLPVLTAAIGIAAGRYKHEHGDPRGPWDSA